MRIALVVDHPQRDLPGLVLVAGRLCEAGATCYLVPLDLQGRELTALAPDLVLLNYLRRNNQALAGSLQSAGVRVAVLDTEGGVMETPEVYERTMATDPEVRARVVRLLTWGPRLAAEAGDRGWYPAERIRVTGGPRFDFYCEPWREVPRSRPSGADRIPEPRVLFTPSYSFLSPRFGSLEEEVRGLERLGYDPGFLRRRVEIERRGLDAFVELAEGLSAGLPEVHFVLRPHPFERAETYRERLPERPNLHVDQEGTLDGWLVRSRALIQSSCTSAVEGALAGVPVLTPAWIPVWRRVEVLERAAVACESPEELRARLEGVLSGTGAGTPDEAAACRAAVFEWFFESDGEAHRRVADALLDSADGAPGPDRRRCRRLHYRPPGPARRAASRLAAGAKEALGLPVSWSLRRLAATDPAARWDASAKAFHAPAVEALIASIAAAAPEADPWSRGADLLSVRAARRPDDYSVPIDGGRAVVLAPR